MALETLHFFQGLSRTPLLFIPRYLTNIFVEYMLQQNICRKYKNKLEIWKFENPWAPVSEPGFLKFQIFRFSILEIFVFWENIFENHVGEISRNK